MLAGLTMAACSGGNQARTPSVSMRATTNFTQAPARPYSPPSAYAPPLASEPLPTYARPTYPPAYTQPPVGQPVRAVEAPYGPAGVASRYKLGAPYSVGGVWYVPREDQGYDRNGAGSWYGADFHGRSTANGEIYNMNALTAAHPTLPLPSYVTVTNLANNRTVLLRVNDRGPYVAGRIIDLSRAAARALGYEQSGTAPVRVRYAGRAPLDGNDSRERQFLAAQPWAGGQIAAAQSPAKPYAVQPYGQPAGSRWHAPAALPANAAPRYAAPAYPPQGLAEPVAPPATAGWSTDSYRRSLLQSRAEAASNGPSGTSRSALGAP